MCAAGATQINLFWKHIIRHPYNPLYLVERLVDIWMPSKPVVQVRGAALGDAQDVVERDAAQALGLTTPVVPAGVPGK